MPHGTKLPRQPRRAMSAIGGVNRPTYAQCDLRIFTRFGRACQQSAMSIQNGSDRP
jgi:hypothetical protein